MNAPLLASFLDRLARPFSAAATVLLLTLSLPDRAAASDCSERYPFGAATLRTSDHQAGVYGADLSLLHGAWSWEATFGLATGVAKSLYYVRDIAELVRDCVGDLRAGRLSFARHWVETPEGARAETDEEYFDRIFDELIDVRLELGAIENGYLALLALHAPLVPASAVDELKGIVNDTLLRVLEHSANRSTGIGWVVGQMQALTEATEDFQTSHALVRSLIVNYLGQYPSMREAVITQLEHNTHSVLDQYEQFFSPQQRAALEALLEQLDDEREEEDLNQLVINLTAIADDIQDHVNTLWMGPLRDISSKLKFLFGGCDASDSAHPLTWGQYFGDLPVSATIVQEGSHAAFCD
jgi:hypothetical protein